ncbi:MAG TPA: gliding motility-associated C-terminal domain-containing protein [Flavobacteriales bacterium]|nr:gliding motility-associated C-terminal domain-containing protein [Flavobacteriales bacterium]
MQHLRNIALASTMALVMCSQAQVLPEFNMTDTVVTICKGILLDSEEGPGGNLYGNNEDFVFTIDAGSQITLVFQPVFCLEQGYDFLTFHNGPSVNSPQIGPSYSGTTAPPPITASSGVLTIHFVSDPTVAYCGFEAQWTSIVAPPVPPVMTIPSAPVCGSGTIGLRFSYPIACDSIAPGAFSITGQGAPAVTGAGAVGCNGGETVAMQLSVDPPFERNCPYTVSFRIGIYDRCDSLWFFTITANTQVVSCPIAVEVLAERDTICSGSCVDLTADVNGCLTYTYAWDNGLAPVRGPISVCPTATTTYSVTATETGTGNQASNTITIVVLDPQVVGAPATVCQSLDAFDLVGSPPGGWWTGDGILDSLSGTFDPDTAGPGAHVLTYGIPGGCEAAITLFVDSMDAGLDEAACPGTAPFMIQDNTPQGGTWSGPFIQPNGLFDPSTVGSYVVTYSAGSCSDTKTINVDNITGQTQLDTVCQSTFPFDIPVQPWGGRWSGAGIVDTLRGTFDPDEAEGGTHILTYALHGCDRQFTIHVKPVDIGGSRSACPAQPAPFALDPAAFPAGGTWAGGGIVDASNGTYDPVQAGNGWDELLYFAPNGCVDTIGILVGYTAVDDDTLFFCSNSDELKLDDGTTGRTPWDGTWSGPSISQNSDGDWFFDPQEAGVGVHVLHFDANTCGDSLLAIVHPASLAVTDMTVCAAIAPFPLATVPPGATFSGAGADNDGMFDPAAAGEGTHMIHYDTPAGCTDSVLITVIPFVQAELGGVQDTYCSNDVEVTITFSPLGGVFTGMNSITFNPSTLTDGDYTLVYQYGSGDCQSTDTLHFTDHPPLTTELVVSNNPICTGGGSEIQVITSGGDPDGLIDHQWDNGLFPAATQNASPTTTTTYHVLTTDGCSDVVADSITIVVHPPFEPQFAFSPMQCHGDPGYVIGSVTGTGTYTFSWDLSPTDMVGDSIALPAGGLAFVTVTNNETGCATDSLIRVPSWPAITALFSSNPNEECIDFDQRDVTFIDLSNNAVAGFWVINGDTVPYEFGVNPHFDLGTAGYYETQLVVWNEGNCVDSMSLDMCIRDSEAIFIPDVFSPNGDGNNDVLFVRGPTIIELDFAIYDRWGARLFSTTSVGNGWDGTVDGDQSTSGVYLYTLTARTEDGDELVRTGNITLVR